MSELSIKYRNFHNNGYPITINSIDTDTGIYVNVESLSCKILHINDLKIDINVINYINYVNITIFDELLIDEVYIDSNKVYDVLSSPYIDRNIFYNLREVWEFDNNIGNINYSIDEFKDNYLSDKKFKNSVINVYKDNLHCHVYILFKLIYKYMTERHVSDYSNESKVDSELKDWIDSLNEYGRLHPSPEVIKLRREVDELKDEVKLLKQQNKLLEQHLSRYEPVDDD